MKLNNHPIALSISIVVLVLCVLDTLFRLIPPAHDIQEVKIPEVPQFNNKTTKIDGKETLERFLPFDVRWQNEVKRAQEAQQNQEEDLPLFEQTITLSAIISENTTVALLKKERMSTQQVEFIKLSVGDNLAKFTVIQINDVSVILKNTNGDLHSLQLFKPTNYLTFTVNNNDQ